MVNVYFQGINSFSMVIPALNHQWGCNRYLGNAQIGSASLRIFTGFYTGVHYRVVAAHFACFLIGNESLQAVVN